MSRIVTFGEIMGRLTPPGNLRLSQSIPGNLCLTFGGAEANVAVAVSQFGGDSSFVTALPQNALADACVTALRALGVNTSDVIRTQAGRLGLYFLETGANQRPSKVIYDRDGSSISLAPPSSYDWTKIFQGAQWLHVSGITPAISQLAAEATLSAVREARSRQLTVSCDLNYRKMLWRWDPSSPPHELAQRTLRELLPFVDMVIANEEDASDVLSIQAKSTDLSHGIIAVERYPEVAREVATQFPNLSWIAITLRESISASHNNWGAMLYQPSTDTAWFAPTRDGEYDPYEIRNIVDRVGAGDAFAGALIFAMTTPDLSEPETALSFAVAASCLAHSMPGDFILASRAEVEALMKGATSGRVMR